MVPRVAVVFFIGAACLLAGCATKTVAPPPPGTTGPPAPHVNQPPDGWFAGSDPDDPSAGWQTLTGLYGGRYLDFALTGWSMFPGVPNSLLGPDSLLVLPAARRARKTFYEIYNDRLWIRQEGDTVHLNSFVVFPSGGSDTDSPYAVNVNTALLPDSLRKPVLTPGPANGSPVGFRVRVQVKDSAGQIEQPSESTTYPVYDPASVFHKPEINGYWELTLAGKGYAVVSAVDGDGAVDRSVDQRPGGAVGIADRVDAGGGSAEDVVLRAKVLTFYVNHPAVLLRDRPAFFPTPGATLPRNVGDPAAGRASTAFQLPAADDDWLDPTRLNPAGGAPYSYPQILRWKIAILGKRTGTDQDTCYILPNDYTSALPIRFTIPDWIAAGPVTVRVRLCDCLQCDALPGTRSCPFAGREVAPQQGTCTDTDIPCQLVDQTPDALTFNHR